MEIESALEPSPCGSRAIRDELRSRNRPIRVPRIVDPFCILRPLGDPARPPVIPIMETLAFGFKTDQGRSRKANQDSYSVLDRPELGGLADGLFVVADGMGGRAGGEIASRVTVETVPKVVREVLVEDKRLEPAERMRNAVHEALLAANEAVFGQAKANPELRGMGTTCVAVLVKDDLAVVGNIGDSRVYLLREGGFRPLTHDHSLVA